MIAYRKRAGRVKETKKRDAKVPKNQKQQEAFLTLVCRINGGNSATMSQSEQEVLTGHSRAATAKNHMTAGKEQEEDVLFLLFYLVFLSLPVNPTRILPDGSQMM